MPTKDRLEFLPQAFQCFRQQTYPSHLRELLIADDGSADARGSIPNDLPVRYFRLSTPATIGAKRNLLCEEARGPIIIHWDDDDYSAPSRIEEQVRLLLSSGKQVTGFRTMVFIRADGQRWLYTGAPNYALGTSLCYRKDWWAAHRFPAIQVSEDTHFVQKARNVLISVDAGDLMYARIHSGNTSPRTADVLKSKSWSKLP